MLVFAQKFVAFISQGDHSSNVDELLIPFSRFNLFPFLPDRYNFYQNSHYLSRSY